MKKITFKFLFLTALFIIFTSCGGGSGGGTTTYSIGGTVSGLVGTVVLQNNGGDDLTITVDGSFTFSTGLANLSAYKVTVSTQPDEVTCTAWNNDGIVNGANVTDVSVTCATTSHTIGGEVSGLNGTLVLQNNHGDDLIITENGDFTFLTEVADDAGYEVTVESQPNTQTCTAWNNSGVVDGENIIDVQTICSTVAYTVGGEVSGLNGTLILQNNYDDDLTVTENGEFTFLSALADSSVYEVTVRAQPDTQSCAVTNSSGTIAEANITDIEVSCLNSWARSTVEANTSMKLNGLIVDDDGNTYAVGKLYFGQQEADFGNNVTVSGANFGDNAVIVKYDFNGVAQWAKSTTTGNSASEFFNVGIDGEGNLFAVGLINGNNTFSFGSGDINGAYASGNNAVIVKYNSSGDTQWAQTTVTASNKSRFQDISVDADGNAYIVGYIYTNPTYRFSNSITVSGNCSFSDNALLIKYDTAGNAQWAKSTTTAPHSSQFSGVSVDSNGNIYTTGYIKENGTYNFGGTASVAGSYSLNKNTVVVKYDSSGTGVWAKSTTTASAASTFIDISMSTAGDAYVVGNIYGDSIFGFGNSVEVAGGYGYNDTNLLIVKYSSSGDAQWAKSTTTASNLSEFNSVSADDADAVYASGHLYGNYLFGFGNDVTTTPAYSNSNAVTVKYDTGGNAQWAKSTTIAKNFSTLRGISVNADGDIYASGSIVQADEFVFGDGITVTGGYNGGTNPLVIKYDALTE